MLKIMVIYGTRPEAIKMAPLVSELQVSDQFKVSVVVTGQHREMLDQVNSLFDVKPDWDLDLIQSRQSLDAISVRALTGLGSIIRSERPDMVVVQGDTTTAFVGALAAFYEKVPVAHLEAGLRTKVRYSPFPEEMNRRLTAQLASLHLAPTPRARINLVREGVDPSLIWTTGNTGIDALLRVVAQRIPVEDESLNRLTYSKVVLVTCHRRESWGGPMASSARAISRLAAMFPDVGFVLPAHLNPIVRETLLPPLAAHANVVVTEPLSYSDFAGTMQRSHVVLTDSGGVQEEAPSLGKPVLVMRDNTERPEAVDAGSVRLVGCKEDEIVGRVADLLTDSDLYSRMSAAVNPYGDGKAAERSVRAIGHFFGIDDPPTEFIPSMLGNDSEADAGEPTVGQQVAADRPRDVA